MRRPIILTLSGLLWTGILFAQAQPTFTISTIAGNGNSGFSGDNGLALSAGMNPNGVAVDAANNLYIVDISNVRIRKVAPNGVITTFAGTDAAGFGGDGGQATQAMLNQPSRVAVDASGNVYIADSENNRVRKVTPAGIITTVAGNGNAGYSGDGGPAVKASFNFVADVALDGSGNLYIADNNNVVRKVDASGIVTTVAGNGNADFSGDGGAATRAALNTPRGLAIDSAGNLFIADMGNERIRKVSNGIISTVAGSGVAGYSGDGGSGITARLNNPAGLCVDSSGNLYITDRDNNRIRQLTNGTIATVAGNGSGAFSGDGGPATSAALYGPRSVACSGSQIYIADSLNERIRLLTPVLQNPSINTGGVLSASAFGGFTAVSPGSWIEIYGSNLSGNTRGWGGNDFNGINAPTSLDGTKVTVGGQSAYVDFISPTQVNALIPSNVPLGLQQITVTNAAGISSPFTIMVNPVEPGLLAPSSFTVNGVPYAVALFADGTYVLPTGAIPGINSRQAKPGETIVLYGVGFGPVVPAIPAGQLVQQANNLASGFQVFIGGVPAMTSYAGLAPNYTGLYQINLVVPNVAAGNAPLTFTLAGAPGAQKLNIAVGN